MFGYRHYTDAPLIRPPIPLLGDTNGSMYQHLPCNLTSLNPKSNLIPPNYMC